MSMSSPNSCLPEENSPTSLPADSQVNAAASGAASHPGYAAAMQSPWTLALLVLAVLADLAFTYAQNLQLRIDGDLAAIVLPRADYDPVLHDPFGWQVLTQGAWYAATNRFFSHIVMREYCLHVPQLLQAFVNPVDSIYLSIALLNTAGQALLLYVLGWYATGTRHLRSPRLWLAMALMTPFFQITGYNGQMAVIDNAFTYNFFYAFPLLLLLVLLWPFYRCIGQAQPLRLGAVQLVAMLALLVVLAFSGPIIGGTALVLLLGVVVHRLRRRLPLAGRSWQALLLWGWLGGLCLYSFYIGRHNTENLILMLPVWERYRLVPLGVFDEMTSKLGLPLLVLGCLINWWLLRRLPATLERQHIGRVLKWLGCFTLVYVLLLPLGGYREYRPLILRHDSILPITVGLIGFYALSAGFLLPRLAGRTWHRYVAVLGLMALIFTHADRRLARYNSNARERRALLYLARTDGAPVVRLPEKCSVMSWDPILNPAESLTNAELLMHWGVTKNRKLYYYAAP